jgi:hypothetical protein
MGCPRQDKLILLSMNLLEPASVSELNEHISLCTGCRDKFTRARRQHAALMRTYEALDRSHDELREQLMASLPDRSGRTAVPALATPAWRRLGGCLMNNPKVHYTTAALAVAACVVFLFTLLLNPTKSLALLEIGQAIQQTKSIVARVSLAVTGGQFTKSFEGKTYISDEYGSRTDLYQGDQLIVTTISPLDGTSVSKHAAAGTKVRVTFADRGEFAPGRIRPDDYILRLQGLAGKADKSLGLEIIEGHRALGYEIPGEKLGLTASPSTLETVGDRFIPTAKLWVDADTLLPVRYTVKLEGPEKGSVLTVVCDNFAWDVPLEPSLFDVTTLEDDSALTIDLKVPSATEEALVEGLRLFIDLKLLGDAYPKTLNFSQIGMEVFQHLAALPADQRPDLGSPRNLMQRMMPLYAGTLFYQKLLRDDHEPEYFGSSVTPGDADAVLLRWRLESGGIRVIHGDLSTETVPAAD